MSDAGLGWWGCGVSREACLDGGHGSCCLRHEVHVGRATGYLSKLRGGGDCGGCLKRKEGMVAVCAAFVVIG